MWALISWDVRVRLQQLHCEDKSDVTQKLKMWEI